MTNLLESSSWQALTAHQNDIVDDHMRDYFSTNPDRFSEFSLCCSELFLDFSRNRIQQRTLGLLCNLAESVGLKEKVQALFAGLPVNITEKRSVLHTALRDFSETPIMIKGENIAPLIKETQARMREMTIQIHQGRKLGVTGKPLRHIINIGIGGSHLGPMMCYEALRDFAASPLEFHFVSTVDKAILNDVLNKIDPETSLFIVSSKTFSTIETLTNANSIAAWIKAKLGPSAMQHHFIAITMEPQKAMAFGIAESNILPLWEWVGGRYSIWSPIGFPLMLLLGPKQHEDFLRGAFEVDQHFKTTSFAKNMPVIMALLGIWYRNFWQTHVQAIIPYAHKLRYFIDYLQQAEMESNGKSISLSGKELPYATGPVIFGEEGCNGQHAYHQLLLQGNQLIPVDFILIGKNAVENDIHQDVLIASGLSQAQALMRGKTYDESYQELLLKHYTTEEARFLAQHRVIPGNRPSNIIYMEALTPKSLGALIAVYEHKIFVQGCIWDINSFDQWGVELGKQLLPNILKQVQGKAQFDDLDCATLGMINQIRKNREKV